MSTPAESSSRARWCQRRYLRNYALPGSIKDRQQCSTTLQKPLGWHNYAERFHLLLHLEELHQKTEIEKCNQHGVTMLRHKKHRDVLTLQIPDDAIDMPTEMLPGNLVLVTPLDHSGHLANTKYKGHIHHVDTKQIYLQFTEQFVSRFKEGMRFNVSFALNRLSLYMQHRAVHTIYRHKLKEVLFPTGRHSSHCTYKLRLSDDTINEEQQIAIEHIVAASAKPAPYLVFGPPGTGKTTTLVEVISHIVKTQLSCKILVCAPSNSATDHLCEKILERIDKSLVYRLYALSYAVTSIPNNLKSCSNLIDEITLEIPTKVELMKYTILATTLLTAGRLVSMGVSPRHYSYIFVDEAGQATETESIIPLSGLLTSQTCQVVLAGDPKQLGPVITSRIAANHGLGVSLMERLMRDVHLYETPFRTDQFNMCFITMLLRNYRSHPKILKIPSELFYDGSLKNYAPVVNCSAFCKWSLLPQKDFPLIFHGVAGVDEHDANSQSVYNMAEVAVLMEYLKAFLDHFHKTGGTEIGPKEIGIITPYRKQVEKIRNAIQMDEELVKENLENVLVGSVEKFQGKEFHVILLSTVRSSPKLNAPQPQFTIGFVGDEKRFNVALTRAQALLIVVGNPRALKTNGIWNKFIHYCYSEGAYRGIAVPDVEDEQGTPTPLTKPLEQLELH